jgi:hypothetical protein
MKKGFSSGAESSATRRAHSDEGLVALGVDGGMCIFRKNEK